MVPAAISVIHCHLRWRDGSLWHWPLTHPTFFSEWRIMLIVTPLSATQMCLGDGDWRTEELQMFEGGVTPCFVSPQRRETSLLLFALPGSLCGRLPLPCAPLFHFTCPNQNRRYMWPGEPFLPSFWEHGPLDSAGLRCRADWILESVYFTAHQADEFQIQIRAIHSFPSIQFTWLWFMLLLGFYSAIAQKMCFKNGVNHTFWMKPGSTAAHQWEWASKQTTITVGFYSAKSSLSNIN